MFLLQYFSGILVILFGVWCLVILTLTWRSEERSNGSILHLKRGKTWHLLYKDWQRKSVGLAFIFILVLDSQQLAFYISLVLHWKWTYPNSLILPVQTGPHGCRHRQVYEWQRNCCQILIVAVIYFVETLCLDLIELYMYHL